MTQISNALLEPSAPPAPQGKEPPGSQPDTPFAALLDDHQARTAVAEGHKRAPVDPDAGSAERGDDATPAKPGSPDAASLAALLGGVPLPADASVSAAPAAAVGPADPEPAGGRVDLVPPTQASREQARGIVLTRATRPIGVPADATSLPLRPPVPGAESAVADPAAASSPSLPVGLGAAAADGRATAVANPVAAARATRLADVLQAAVRPTGAAADPAATPSPATVAGAAGRAPSAANGQSSAQAATPATPATPTIAAATPAPSSAAPASAPAEPVVPVRAVGLEHAVETVRLALRHGAERGVTHARISLTPRELGSIEVHLRQTAEGLVARVVAEHGAAAQQLQQAGAELRRSLEQQGLTLLRLDIGASGDEAAGRRGAAFDTAAAFGDDRGSRRDGDDPLAPLDGGTDAPDAPDAATTLQLPNGALVDVLA